MSWALHYAIELERPLSQEEGRALDQLCERRSLSLDRVVAGVGRVAEWKGLIPDQEYARLEKLYQASPADGSWTYRGFIQVRSTRHLCRLVAWLQEVERLLPVDTFVISEDYSIEKCRPSEVDLEALKRKAQAERRNAEEDDDEPDAQDLAVEALLEEGKALESRKLDEVLAAARKDFALWKNPKK